MFIGPHQLHSNVLLAPMAGITDAPFRDICLRYGAGMAASEMVTSDSRLVDSRKTSNRLKFSDNTQLRVVQIVGSDPHTMAEAAQLNTERGAQIIDINMGCPAKKVCKKAAGSALLRDEALVKDILCSVVTATEVPVTLKIRTGWAPNERNGVRIARIAEDAGIQALAVHGRTRACRFKGQAEFDTIAAIKQSIKIPVIANGDIKTPQQAQHIIEYTKADAVMLGRAAQGQPWIFHSINHFLKTGTLCEDISLEQKTHTIREHIAAIHRHYGDYLGVRIARKHITWYLEKVFPNNNSFSTHFKHIFHQLTDCNAQLREIDSFYAQSNYAEVKAA